jgi:hypothetical protein
MSAIADITVYDGASTPVSHTLTSVSVTRNGGAIEALWRENASGVPVDASISAAVKLQQLKSGVYKTDLRVQVPVMESISGQNAAGYTAAPKVAYVNTVQVTGFFHERSDSDGRALVTQIAANLLNNISTSVAAPSAGPVPELFQTLVAPT